MRRRALLGYAFASAVSVGVAGCSATPAPVGATDPAEGTTDAEQSTWSASADCDSMHENVIEVEWVRGELADGYAPIPFSDLTAGEAEILETVVEEGGVANCEVSTSFRRFVDRVMTHRERQDEFMVYLRYEGSYYGLYVQQGDQVFSGR